MRMERRILMEHQRQAYAAARRRLFNHHRTRQRLTPGRACFHPRPAGQPREGRHDRNYRTDRQAFN